MSSCIKGRAGANQIFEKLSTEEAYNGKLWGSAFISVAAALHDLGVRVVTTSVYQDRIGEVWVEFEARLIGG